MEIFVLTKILQHDADTAFTAGISADIWQKIGESLGLSEPAVTAAAAIAIGAPIAGGTAPILMSAAASANTASVSTTNVNPFLLAMGAAAIAAAATVIIMLRPVGLIGRVTNPIAFSATQAMTMEQPTAYQLPLQIGLQQIPFVLPG